MVRQTLAQEITQYLTEQGAVRVGFADLHGVAGASLPYGITALVALPREIVGPLVDQPHRAYYDAYQAINVRLDAMAEGCAALLRAHGYQATANTEEHLPTGAEDRSPLPHKAVACRAGLGWIGKNTNLIIPGKGSFFFLGEIVTTLEADHYDTPQKNRCGSCTRCLDACPTGALEGPRHLNARKCLSYLTIENRGEIPVEQAARLGNRLYGCDTCQEVCPWNRFARPTQIEAFRPKPTLLSLRKEDLKVFSREDYNRIFAKSAVKRAKYEGLIRNIHNLKD